MHHLAQIQRRRFTTMGEVLGVIDEKHAHSFQVLSNPGTALQCLLGILQVLRDIGSVHLCCRLAGELPRSYPGLQRLQLPEPAGCRKVVCQDAELPCRFCRTLHCIFKAVGISEANDIPQAAKLGIQRPDYGDPLVRHRDEPPPDCVVTCMASCCSPKRAYAGTRRLRLAAVTLKHRGGKTLHRFKILLGCGRIGIALFNKLANRRVLRSSRCKALEVRSCGIQDLNPYLTRNCPRRQQPVNPP
mmetsp:Transcript_87112/g.198835  ORF Transcript_87112/g.198835 Transcript_87112/m.198835 type:complete len:244 (+) Transcript_87112:2577-3308(+)